LPQIELTYQPRELQAAIHRGMDTHRFGAVVCHRRFGKTVLAINHLQIAALECRRERPRFAFIGPTYTQTKGNVWDYLVHYASPIPGCKVSISELSVTYPNGGQVRLFGADNPDSLRGFYFDGVVHDEFGLQPPRIFSEVIRPALSDRQGWALFLGTPAGKNQFYEVIHGKPSTGQLGAKADPAWFFAEYKASQTGIIAPEELAAARKDMTEDEYQQEYECSFEASVKGAIYAAELAAARATGRVCAVPYDPILPVDTFWDLGIGDATSIWFCQSLRAGEVRVIDYHEESGEGLPHYAQVLKDKGYTYGTHWAPHDIAVRELGSGRSRVETAATLGIQFNICPNIPIEEGIHAARMLFPRCWFDETKCQAGLEALQHYRRDFNSRLNEFKAAPVHDWAEHGSSAFRYLAVAHQTPRERPTRSPGRLAHGDQAWMA
jgi:phage terminase large subunit